MKILVTGGSGFIGRNLVEYLSADHAVLAPNRLELNMVDELAVADYLHRHQVDVVIHSAGKPGHRNAKDPSGVFYANTRMFFNLVRNRDHFGRMLIIGSGGGYDSRHYQPKMPEEYFGQYMPEDEHGFFRFVTGKFIAEMGNVFDLRLFGVFGKYEDYAIRFISNAICKAIYDLPITLRQNRRFDYLYVRDLMPIIDHFLFAPLEFSEYNLTPDNSVELLELAKMVREISGKDLPIIVAKEGVGQEYSGDNSRLRREMQEFTFTPIEEAIEELYCWYEKHRDQIDKSQLLFDK